MWADSDTDIDFLNYSEVAEMIADLVADPKLLPISIGVFGGWGMGKSSTLKLVERELQKSSETHLVIKFDAWMYQDFDDARAALMSVISGALVEASPPSFKAKAQGLLGRVNKIRLLGLAVEGGAMAIGLPTFGFISKALDAASAIASGSKSTENVDALRDAVGVVQEKVGGLVNEKTTKGPPEEIDSFRAEFGEVLAGLNKTMVVFIDNLDRCLPENAIETLEAVRLFLFMPNTAFVVAADEDMIRHAVSQHFSNPLQRHVTDYIDKLIQIPVRVPRAGVQEVRAYLFLLLASRSELKEEDVERMRAFLIKRLRMSWQADSDFTVRAMLDECKIAVSTDLDTALSMADRIAPLLAHTPGVLGNPRTVKRMLNVVRMRSNVARRREMPLDEAMITKLALFERCTDNEAAETLHNLINSANDGKPSILVELETTKSGELVKGLPDEWKKHSEFLAKWSKIKPDLGGVDLRPAVYLARETIPLRGLSQAVSPAAAKAIETLLQVRTVSSHAAKSALDALPATDLVPTMEGLIEAMRANSDWRRARNDFRGAILVADRSAAAASVLVQFFKSLQLPSAPGWVSTMVSEKEWWEE